MFDFLLYFPTFESILIPLAFWGIFLQISQFGLQYTKNEDFSGGWDMVKWGIGRISRLTSLFFVIITLYIVFAIGNTALMWFVKTFYGWEMVGNMKIPEIQDAVGIFCVVVIIFIVGMLMDLIKRLLTRKRKVAKAN